MVVITLDNYGSSDDEQSQSSPYQPSPTASARITHLPIKTNSDPFPMIGTSSSTNLIKGNANLHLKNSDFATLNDVDNILALVFSRRRNSKFLLLLLEDCSGWYCFKF